MDRVLGAGRFLRLAISRLEAVNNISQAAFWQEYEVIVNLLQASVVTAM